MTTSTSSAGSIHRAARSSIAVKMFRRLTRHAGERVPIRPSRALTPSTSQRPRECPAWLPPRREGAAFSATSRNGSQHREGGGSRRLAVFSVPGFRGPATDELIANSLDTSAFFTSAVALAADPKLRPGRAFTGMNPEETRQMIELVQRVRKEQTSRSCRSSMTRASSWAYDIITVLNFDRSFDEGTPEEVRTNRRYRGHIPRIRNRCCWRSRISKSTT